MRSQRGPEEPLTEHRGHGFQKPMANIDIAILIQGHQLIWNATSAVLPQGYEITMNAASAVPPQG